MTAYDEAIVKTFRVNALRTAHIIDDAFPTYSDLVADGGAKSKYLEWELAGELYGHFRTHHMPCDVDNTVNSVKGDVERIRKSDLIVLDYNLAPGDTRQSVALVRDLARTRHFNTIIVYTAAEDLKQVWLNFAAALRGGWSSPSESDAAIDAELAGLIDDGLALDPPSTELMADYVIDHALGGRNSVEINLHNDAFEAKAVAADRRAELLKAAIRREIRDFLKDDDASRTAAQQSVDGRCVKDRPQWLQSGNCFVAILGKPTGGKKSVAADNLFEALDAALCDWRPNLLQILVSEIQNILESEAIATDELHLRDPHTQVSLCYFLLLALADGEEERARTLLDAPVYTLLDKLVEGVRQKLLGDHGLQELGGDLLAEELARLSIPAYPNRGARRKGLFGLAEKMAGARGSLDAQEALLKLNAFLSSERFRGHLTTGTVFTDGETHWICMTPACDMVDRPPGEDQEWLNRLHPMKPIIAARLKTGDISRALKNAEYSRSLFLRGPDGTLAFDALLDTGGPVYEFLYFDGGAPKRDETHFTFTGSRMWRDAGAALPAALMSTNFKVVGQIRSDYASRFLQQTGAWLSRIGVDFVRSTG